MVLGRGINILVVGLSCTVTSGLWAQYTVTNLVSDGSVPAPITDPLLNSPLGLCAGSGVWDQWWVANQASGMSTIYDLNGAIFDLAVTVPESTNGANSGGSPAAVVANNTGGFIVNDGREAGPAKFIFATKDGTISSWWPQIAPPMLPDTAKLHYEANDGAVYTALAIAPETRNGPRLLVADFFNGKIDVFDSEWNKLTLPGAFVDATLPRGFAPYGISVIDSKVYVAYAKQNVAKTDIVTGPTLGFVNVFDPEGSFVMRFVSGAELNGPYGFAKSPTNFGAAGGAILISNVGDGRVNAYFASTGGFKTYLINAQGPVQIDGLHGIAFGKGDDTGPANTLYFTANGTNGNKGLLGRIDSDDQSDPDPDPDPDPGFNADIDGNQVVDGADLGLLLAAWDSSDESADLNGDGIVDGADLGLLLSQWTP